MSKAKTGALLSFLKAVATLRRKRVATYGSTDRVLWLNELPRDLSPAWKGACRSAFFADKPDDLPDLWLEVRKKHKPEFPPLPEELRDWVDQKYQQHPDEYIYKEVSDLLSLLKDEITVLVEPSDSNMSAGAMGACAEQISELRRLRDYPGIEDVWLEYLENQWKPWAEEMRQWQQVQDIYEKVDFMRRRLEEAEERYELVLAVGLLQWRDPSGGTVKRHLLTAPAEISLDATRGILTVGPAASFEKFRVAFDMLELQHWPRLEATDLEDRLEELDVCAWDKARVAEILRIIANKLRADAQVLEDAWAPLERTDETPRVLYAPALVLRERRPRAYEESISRFVEACKDEETFPTTAPWERFVSEGELPSTSAEKDPDAPSGYTIAETRLYLPLAMNEEQRRIAERLRTRPYVLVKGPPGTGKSHTIANLICHLLAKGQRVLVTAHAPKALTVLRELLPKGIRDLCVTALGSSREDHRLLEDSVREILSRKNEWKGQTRAQAEIERLEKELCEIEGQIAEVDRQLRECREAETHVHTLSGNYTGTAARIARQIEKERAQYGWFPELDDDQQGCPLAPEEISFLADVHGSLTPDWLKELGLEIGEFVLPDHEWFEGAVEKLNSAETNARVAGEGLVEDQLRVLQGFSNQSLEACAAFLSALEEQVARAKRTLGYLANEILKDLLVGETARWNRLEREVVELVKKIQVARERVGAAKIDIPVDTENGKLLMDTRRRLERLKNGGWRGWGFLAPRIMRETRYIEKCCRVNGGAPRGQESLEVLLGYLELRECAESFYAVWPAASSGTPDDPRRAVNDVCEIVEQYCELLRFFRNCDREALSIVPFEKREALAKREERAAWRHLVKAELARRRAEFARKPFDEWLRLIRGVASANHHPCIDDLASAIEQRDVPRWRVAWEKRESLRRGKDRLQEYKNLLHKVEAVSPELATLVRSTQGDRQWADRLRHLQQAWDWATAKAWLRRVTAPECYLRLTEERHRLQSRLEKKLEELIALKAWHAFFARLDDVTEQNLVAWTRAVARIGKGTGKYAYRHQRTARQYLMACVPKIPAWVMPLHKLWETVDAQPGVFDTVIVDEASQAGVEALALLLLATRIVVVGDDKQNSPEAVGVLEDDIARLAREFLGDFRFRDEFRPDTSLYDHAERAFGNVIQLREHFRCVPEIIRFSNELCYTDAPLIPLRQPPPKRLPPLKAELVAQGFCEGDSARILNKPEAEVIVERICACLEDEAYEGKTMGVIVLQGHAQAEYIERRLAEVLEPRVREERKLRCGVPATFQGDQRDVIFLSLVVAPNHPFRALTELEAQRRFNVAMSRARDQVWLFHSVQLSDLNPADLRYRLLQFFLNSNQAALEGVYEELDRLEREAKRLHRQPGEQPDPYESWFEVDVALELLRRKYRVRPQVEVAGYRIDLVVEGLASRLAVECDGDAWHGPERFEYDMARQRQLERAGWTFVRIRESEFYADREGAVGRILQACEELDIRPIGEEEPEEDEELEASTTPGAASNEWEEREEQGDVPEREEEAPGGTRGADRGFVPAMGYSEALNFPDPREAPLARVQAALRRLIKEEGPLTKRLLIRLYVERCPKLQRAGKTVKSFLNRALYHMQKAGEIIVEDELGDRSFESQVVRLADMPKVRVRPAGHRDLLEIPPSELWVVLDRIVASQHGLSDDETLMRKLLDHYGFSRLTQKREAYLNNVLRAYRRRTSAG